MTSLSFGYYSDASLVTFYGLNIYHFNLFSRMLQCADSVQNTMGSFVGPQ